jgi:arylsulfatase
MGDAEFRGVVGRTIADSTPWWPEPRRAPDGAPNVLVVLFDDVGFSDFGCYGSEIATPTIDRLAAAGLRYTGFHTTALCSPTRACLLTGRNHHSVGMASLANWDTGFPGARGRIAKSAGTLAETLGTHGYATFATGKWHLTPADQTSQGGPYDQWPLQRGFDRYYGFLEAETNQWRPELTYDNHHVEPPDDPAYHLTEDLVDRAIGFVRDHRAMAPERPFLLYVALGACHAPHHVPREYIDRYERVFAKGWDRTREDRLARQKAMGVVPPETELPERNRFVRPWDELGDEEKRLYVRLQAAYAGMLEHADHHLGRLIAFLESTGELDRTLVLVMSDNGASQEGSPFGTVNAARYMNRVRDDLAYNMKHLDEIGEAHLNNNYPLGWAMAGNTPLKRYKQTTHGGGVRDPLVIHWPAGIRERGGIRRQFHHVIDVFPTVLEIVGVEPPTVIDGVPQQPVEGVSLVYTFQDATAPTAKHTQYFEMFGHRGLWHDGWKAMAWHPPGKPYDEDRWELYQLDRDFSECRDLAAEHPDKLQELIERWWVEAGKYQVLPLDDRTSERWEASAARGGSARRRFVFHPGISHVPSVAAPDIRNRSYSITAEVVMPAAGAEGAAAGAEGVVIAHGDSCAGYSLYVRNGRLVHDYNFVGTHYVVTSDVPVPPGPCTLRFEFTKTGRYAGIGRLFIDAKKVGEVRMPQTMPAVISWEGLDVGRDSLVPVGDYAAPFPFTGTIRRVVVELANDQQLDRAATFSADAGRQ